MTIFEKISDARDRIENLREKLFCLEVQSVTPKTSEITGMPKDFGNASNPLEQYLIRKEELERKLGVQVVLFEKSWKYAVRRMNAAKIEDQKQQMMYLRFYIGLKWKDCNAQLQKRYPDDNWNINKCFRVYREVLYRIRRENKHNS